MVSKKKAVKLTEQVFTATVGHETPAQVKLPKPKKHTITYYDYHEVASYLEKLHKKTFRDYANKFGKKGNENAEYQDFWHWIVECNDPISNDSFIYLPDTSYIDEPDTEPWKKEILQYFLDFLGEDYHEKLWVSW